MGSFSFSWKEKPYMGSLYYHALCALLIVTTKANHKEKKSPYLLLFKYVPS